MTPDAKNEYLRNAVMTATPEQLHLMLYDGAIRFASQARDALAKGEIEASCEKLIRAQNIILEMRNGLRHEINPKLCDQLASLYSFIYGRLVEANMKRSRTAIDEALKILNHQRETWQMLIDKTRDERSHVSTPSQARSTSGEAGTTLSLEG